eukprot:7993190-Karenia_brevis.AAC.1
MSLDICKSKRRLRRMKANENCVAATKRLALPYDYKKTKGDRRVYGLKDSATGEIVCTPPEITKVAEEFYDELFRDDADVVPGFVFQ